MNTTYRNGDINLQTWTDLQKQFKESSTYIILTRQSYVDTAFGKGYHWITKNNEGFLALNNYEGSGIVIGGLDAGLVEIELTGRNVITVNAPTCSSGSHSAGLEILNASQVKFTGTGTLTIQIDSATNQLGSVYGIYLSRLNINSLCDLTFESGNIIININVTNACSTYGVDTDDADSIGGNITVEKGASLTVNISSNATYRRTYGLFSNGDINLNGSTNLTMKYTGESMPSHACWHIQVTGIGCKTTIGVNALVNASVAEGLPYGFSTALLESKNNTVIANNDWTGYAEKKCYFKNNSCLVTLSDRSYGEYSHYRYEPI